MNQHLMQAIAAARAGKKPQAKVLLARVIKDEPENVNAWFLLSSLADTEEQKIQHLQKVIELQPDHPAASEQLAELAPTPPEPVAEVMHDYAAESAEPMPDNDAVPEMFPFPQIDMPPDDVPEDPDEAMAWLERLAADQGANLDELPTLSAARSTADDTMEYPALDMAEMESDVPDDPDEAMAWLERLAADQGANLDELPSLFQREETADFEESAEEDQFPWLEDDSLEDDLFLEAPPTTIEPSRTEEDEREESARTLHVSNDFDFVSQSKGDSIPSWLAGEEDFIAADTVITGMPAETDEQPEPENLPDWLNEESVEGWVGDEGEKSGQVVWKAGEGDESRKPTPPAAKKTTRPAAKKQTAAAGSSNLYIILLVLVAVVLTVAILYVLFNQLL
jgi:hypothetical protein